MKKPKNLDFDQSVLGNGGATHAKGAAKFQGTFKHPGNKAPISKGGTKKPVIGRGSGK